MLSQVLAYGKFGNLFCGVELTFTNGQKKINSLLVKKKKDEFLVEKTFECNAITELKEQLPKEQHLFLIINNEKVLFKTLDGLYNTQKAIVTAFPNLQLKDFYYEILQTDTHSFIAICRKDYVDSLIEQYSRSQLNIIGFSLGNLISSQLTVYIKNNSINSSNASIFFTENNISNIEKSENNLLSNHTINDLELSNKYILPLAGIIAYYTNQNTTISNSTHLNHNLSNDFKQKRIFDIGLKIGLGSIFITLLISFLFFSSYTSKIKSLTDQLEVNETYKNILLKLSDDVQKKERLVNDFSLTSSKSSWYLDRIGMSVPNSILFSNIQFQPLVKSIKKDKEIIIQEHLIIIKGKSSNSNNFSSWINKLEQQNWIEKVIIQDYGTGKKAITQFELLIKISK